MCVVSMIGDHYTDKWKDTLYPSPFGKSLPFGEVGRYEFNELKKELEENKKAFEDLKKEVEECKALLKRAKEYDEKNNEPDCEIDEKVELIKKIADLVGVDMTDIFGK